MAGGEIEHPLREGMLQQRRKRCWYDASKHKGSTERMNQKRDKPRALT
jgi:hypothetical protein